eukprot:jgi/Botrbrau1/12218/Bobra.0197s0011.1
MYVEIATPPMYLKLELSYVCRNCNSANVPQIGTSLCTSKLQLRQCTSNWNFPMYVEIATPPSTVTWISSIYPPKRQLQVYCLNVTPPLECNSTFGTPPQSKSTG